MRLREKIGDRSAVIGIMGLGYVGLPLAIEFSRVGFTVYGFDLDPVKISSLGLGKSYVPDVPDRAVASAVSLGRFRPTSDFTRLRGVDAVSICVPTPLRKTKDPDVSYILSAVEDLLPSLHSQMLVTLESTSYPGTTEELIQAKIEKQGFRVGQDIFVCFSPERVDPGNPVYKTSNTPKIVGGITPACTEVGLLLYSQVVDKVLPVSSAQVAEMVKLLENTFRAVNIALVNELALLCERMGIDIWEVVDAAASKPFGFMPFYPGPGIGGHCIPLDPAYLSWKARTYNFYDRFIDLASDINANMPNHVVARIGQVLNLEGKSLYGSSVLCLGLAYKKNVSDIRESPSIDVIRLLSDCGTQIEYSDPYVPEYRDGNRVLRSLPLTQESLRRFDCAVLLTDHSKFDLPMIAEHSRLIFDTRNAFRGFGNNSIFRLGVPLPTPAEWTEVRRGLIEAAARARGESSPKVGEATD